jgi:hypothetical protein
MKIHKGKVMRMVYRLERWKRNERESLILRKSPVLAKDSKVTTSSGNNEYLETHQSPSILISRPMGSSHVTLRYRTKLNSNQIPQFSGIACCCLLLPSSVLFIGTTYWEKVLSITLNRQNVLKLFLCFPKTLSFCISGHYGFSKSEKFV